MDDQKIVYISWKTTWTPSTKEGGEDEADDGQGIVDTTDVKSYLAEFGTVVGIERPVLTRGELRVCTSCDCVPRV